MINKMANICENEYNAFLSLPNVNGVGIGYKEVNNINTQKLCLKVFVEKKVDLDSLSKNERVPKMYKEFITDVVEVGEIYAYANTGKIRPAEGGYSIGLAGSGSVGTLGCLVSTLSGTSLKTYILSNNHVIANNNNAPIGSIILQPGQGDGGVNPTDQIATLSSFVPINFAGGNNLVDCAIGEVTNLSLVSNQIAQIGTITGIASAVLGTSVQKSGRTTGYTTGTINSINTTLNVSFGGGLSAIFIKQITTTKISDPGDSGSIVLDSSNRVIGLLFSGNSTITGINDIRNVLKSFRARLV